MKFLRFLLILVALGVTGIFGYELLNELQKPAEGMEVVMEEVVVEEEVMMDEVTVMTEEEAMEDMNEEPIMVVEEVLEDLFVALTFDGKLKKFAAANGGRVVKLKGAYDITKYGVSASKGAIVNGDLYFKAGGDLYVIHAGELIKLS